MKKIKKAYHYLFYKFYKWYEDAPFVWWSEWKASLSIDLVLYFIIISIFLYYKIFFNRFIHLSENNTDAIVLVLIVGGINYFIFHHQNKWKKIVKEFDQLSIKKNRIGGWLVTGFVCLIIANMIFAFYLMSQVDWTKYR